MTDIQIPMQPVKPSPNWPSLLQLILSLLAAFILLGAAVIVAMTAASKYFTNRAVVADLLQPFMIAASLAFAGALVLPSAWYAWRHIASPGREPTNYPDRRSFGQVLTIVVLVLVTGALVLGNRIVQSSNLAWLLLPPLNIIVNGLPALWVVYIGTRGLLPGAPRRLWGVFATGLVLGPFIILILELLLLVVVGVIALVWVMLNPNLANQFYSFIMRVQRIGPNPDVLIRQLVPLILNPGIIFLMFAYISVLVPLLEEALKPIGVWFMAGQKITPAQGFGYGVLSGAGFGLFENLGNTSGGATDWALVASTRISTLLLHCFTAGLIGWALASVWSERRYLRLLIIYLCAVILHGLWNALALLSAFSSLQGLTDISMPTYLQRIGSYSALGIIVLGMIVLVLYLGSNAFFRRGAIPVSTSPQGTISPPVPPKRFSSSNKLDQITHSEITPNDPQIPSQGENPLQPDPENSSPPNSEKSDHSMGINE